MTPVLTQRLGSQVSLTHQDTLSLTADERTKSRHRFANGALDLYVQLPRGTVLRHGDLLSTDSGDYVVRVVARPEPVITVVGSALALMRAAYHLGNRHVAVEVTETRLRLAPDPVLRSLLVSLGLTVTEEAAPFHPEMGAYGQHAHHDTHHDARHG